MGLKDKWNAHRCRDTRYLPLQPEITRKPRAVCNRFVPSATPASVPIGMARRIDKLECRLYGLAEEETDRVQTARHWHTLRRDRVGASV